MNLFDFDLSLTHGDPINTFAAPLGKRGAVGELAGEKGFGKPAQGGVE
jgi:hypothetical protein